jgi:hypothetical protein
VVVVVAAALVHRYRADVTALRLRKPPTEQTRSLFLLRRVVSLRNRNKQTRKRNNRPPKNDPPGNASQVRSQNTIRSPPPQQHREVTVNGESNPTASDKRCKRREGKRSVLSPLLSPPRVLFCFVLFRTLLPTDLTWLYVSCSCLSSRPTMRTHGGGALADGIVMHCGSGPAAGRCCCRCTLAW